MGWNDYMEQIVMLAKLIKIGHKYDVSLMSQYYFNVKMMFSSLSLTGGAYGGWSSWWPCEGDQWGLEMQIHPT